MSIEGGAPVGSPTSSLLGGEDPAPQPNPQPTQSQWYSALPAEYQSNASLQQYKDLPSFVKSALEAEKMIGKKGVILPTEKDDANVWSKFYNELGRPETPDKYDASSLKSLPAEYQLPEDKLNGMLKNMHDLGLSAKQTKGVIDSFSEMQKNQYGEANTQYQAGLQQTTATLQTEWGQQYQYNLDLAKHALTQFDTTGELKGYLENTGLGNNLALIKMLHKVGTSLGQDQALSGNQGGGFNTTPQAAQQEMDSIYTDPELSKVLMDSNDPRHKEIKMKVQKLAAIAFDSK